MKCFTFHLKSTFFLFAHVHYWFFHILLLFNKTLNRERTISVSNTIVHFDDCIDTCFSLAITFYQAATFNERANERCLLSQKLCLSKFISFGISFFAQICTHQNEQNQKGFHVLQFQSVIYWRFTFFFYFIAFPYPISSITFSWMANSFAIRRRFRSFVLTERENWIRYNVRVRFCFFFSRQTPTFTLLQSTSKPNQHQQTNSNGLNCMACAGVITL